MPLLFSLIDFIEYDKLLYTKALSLLGYKTPGIPTLLPLGLRLAPKSDSVDGYAARHRMKMLLKTYRYAKGSPLVAGDTPFKTAQKVASVRGIAPFRVQPSGGFLFG